MCPRISFAFKLTFSVSKECRCQVMLMCRDKVSKPRSDINLAFLRDLLSINCKALVLLNIGKICDKYVTLYETCLSHALKSPQKLPEARPCVLCNLCCVIGQVILTNTMCSIILYFAIARFHNNEIEIWIIIDLIAKFQPHNDDCFLSVFSFEC